MSRTSCIAASVALLMLAASPALSQSGSSAASGSGGGSSGGGLSGGGLSGGGIGAGGGVSSTTGAPRPVSPTGSMTGSGSGGSGLATGSGSSIRTNADTMTNSGVGVGDNTGISSSAPANASDGTGTGGASTEQLATEGSSTINPANVDTIARTGNAGAATAVQGSGGPSLGDTTSSIGGPPRTSLSGTGRPQDYDIPTPRIGVDLEAIRGAMDAESSATPKSNGN